MLEMGHASRRLAPLCLVLLADRVQHAQGVYRASVLGKDAPDESMRGVYPSPLFQSEFRSGVWQGTSWGPRDAQRAAACDPKRCLASAR